MRKKNPLNIYLHQLLASKAFINRRYVSDGSLCLLVSCLILFPHVPLHGVRIVHTLCRHSYVRQFVRY